MDFVTDGESISKIAKPAGNRHVFALPWNGNATKGDQAMDTFAAFASKVSYSIRPRVHEVGFGEFRGCVDIIGREGAHTRSEERRVGQEGVSTCGSRWSPYH